METKIIKLTMLNEYEAQLNNLFGQYNDNGNLKVLISNINKLNTIWNFSRVDIKNYGIATNNVQFIEYGDNVILDYPSWLKDEHGQGCKIEWGNKNLFFSFKCINDGRLKLILRGMDYRDINNINHPLPVYLNFNKLLINHKIVIDNDDQLIWHNRPFIFETPCENEEYFFVYVKFKTLFDYFPQLNLKMQFDTNAEKIELQIERIKKYMKFERYLLNNNDLLI